MRCIGRKDVQGGARASDPFRTGTVGIRLGPGGQPVRWTVCAVQEPGAGNGANGCRTTTRAIQSSFVRRVESSTDDSQDRSNLSPHLMHFTLTRLPGVASQARRWQFGQRT